jgi:hypothetical protein
VKLPAGGIDLEQLERSLVVQALERSDWNQTRAATLLGINRDQIRYQDREVQAGTDRDIERFQRFQRFQRFLEVLRVPKGPRVRVSGWKIRIAPKISHLSTFVPALIAISIR